MHSADPALAEVASLVWEAMGCKEPMHQVVQVVQMAAAGAAGRVILLNRALRAYIENDGTGQRGRAGAGAAGTESTPLSGRLRVERAPRKRAGDRP